MKVSDLQKYDLPDGPGVYFFKRGREIFYVGKATSLKGRVRSYFTGDLRETRGPKIERMFVLADRLEWQVTDSVLEALLLESALIKKHQPSYNTREKDDKSYWFVVLTEEDFSRILLRRGRQLEYGSEKLKIKKRFGPFPRASEIKEGLKIIRRIFPYRDKCELRSDRKPCFNRQLGLCPGVCTDEITAREYKQIIKNIERLFAGKKGRVISDLDQTMRRAIKTQNFEQAARARDRIFALNHIRDISLLKNEVVEESKAKIRIEAYDVAHLQGQAAVGVMAVWREGEPDRSQFRRFKLWATPKGDDLAGLREILIRRLSHSDWPRPDLVVVDGDQRQVRVAETVLLAEQLEWPVVGVTKDKHHRAIRLVGGASVVRDYRRAIVEINDEAHRAAITYHRQLLRKRK